MTFRSSIELLIPLDVDVLEIWVLPCGVGDNISSSRNCDTSITDIEKRDMITFLGQEMWGPLPLTFLGQEMLSCHVSCIKRAKMGHHKPKTRQKHLLWHSMWSRIIFEKNFLFFFFTRRTHLGTNLFGLPLAACRNPLRPGTGVWVSFRAILMGGKHQKVGGCGLRRCGRNRVLSHVAQDMVCFWFGAIGDQCAQFWGF